MDKAGKIFKMYREKAGITQPELARRMGYSNPQFISNYERGLCTIPLAKAMIFCKETGMKPKEMKQIFMDIAERNITKKFGIGKRKSVKSQGNASSSSRS